MIRAFRWVSAFLAWRGARRDAGPRPGNDDQFREWLNAPGNLAGCSCSARRVAVVHEPGTYCGDAQWDQLFDACTHALDTANTVAAVLDALRGDHRG